MSDAPKTYRTELIVALITAATAIAVSVISNLDKLTSRTPSQPELNEPSIGQSKASSAVFLWSLHQAHAFAQVMDEEGWSVELISYNTVQPDSTMYIDLEFDSNHKYEIHFIPDDSTLSIEGRLVDRLNGSVGRSFYLYTGATAEISGTDANAILLKNPSSEKLLSFSYAVLSKW